jgi:osmotically-inducible protein OsmY
MKSDQQPGTPPAASALTDDEIARAVESAFGWTTVLNKTGIKALVVDGQVTLLGEVDWLYQKRAAQDTVRLLVGVTGVSNQLVIKPRRTLSLTGPVGGSLHTF